MHFFVWAKKCQETHQHCMLDRSAFCLAAKSLAKKALPYGRFAAFSPLWYAIFS